MGVEAVLQDLITLGVVVGGIIYWLVNLRSNERYVAARDAEARAKDAQIATLEVTIRDLKDMTPMKMQEYVASIRAFAEEAIEELQKEIAARDQRFEDLDKRIAAADEREADKVRAVREELEAEKQVLAEELEREKRRERVAASVVADVATLTDLGLIPLEHEQLVNRLVPLAKGSAQMGRLVQLPYPPVDGLLRRYGSMLADGVIQGDDGQHYSFNIGDLAEGLSPDSLKNDQRVAFVRDERPLHYGRARFVRPQERASST